MRPPDHEHVGGPGDLRLNDVCFVAAPDHLRARGLQFFGEATYGALRISFTVRRARDGRLILSFPARDDGAGRRRAIVRPVDDLARIALEREVIAALGLKLETAP